jgi:hypothetical protein
MSTRSKIKRAQRRAAKRATARAASANPITPLVPPAPQREPADLNAIARELARLDRDREVLILRRNGLLEKPPELRALRWHRGDLCPACNEGALAFRTVGRGAALECVMCHADAPGTERPRDTLAWCSTCRRFHADPMCVPGAPKKYRHGEAFCLMKYARKDGSGVEWIWNSRDGVTPFSVPPKDFQGPGTFDDMLSHVDWHLDQVRPDHKPKPGDRVFVDLTPEVARARIAARVDRFWDAAEHPWRESFPSKEEAIEALLRDEARDGAPDIVVVGEEVARG